LQRNAEPRGQLTHFHTLRQKIGDPRSDGVSPYSVCSIADLVCVRLGYYHKAADLNYADTNQERGLGYWYQNHGNSTEYVFWLSRAGNQGSVQSLIEMGDAYDSGKSVPRDEAQANLWWGKALD
jgi:hypothetical protein